MRDALARFSWYIYRVNTPAMRDLFMAPRNYFRMQEALLSLLSGDVFRRLADPLKATAVQRGVLYQELPPAVSAPVRRLVVGAFPRSMNCRSRQPSTAPSFWRIGQRDASHPAVRAPMSC